jgi:hypothetical protein
MLINPGSKEEWGWLDSGTASLQLNQRSIVNLGTTDIASALVDMVNGATITNDGLFAFLDDSNISGSTRSRIYNSGVLTKAAGSASSIDSVFVFPEGGTIEENEPAGVTFDIPNLQPNHGFIDLGTGSTLAVANTLVNAPGGVIKGTGTVSGSLVNSGLIDPDGLGPVGTLTVTGSMTLNPAGSLDVDINNVNSTNIFDSVSVGGAANIGGSLVVDLLPNYIETVGDTFPIITSGGSRQCIFQSVTIHNAGTAVGDGMFVEYHSHDVTLVVTDLSHENLPAITQALSQSSGTTNGGTQVTITGTDFNNVNAVLFGGYQACVFTVNSSSSITATSCPEPASGGTPYDVRVVTDVGMSAITSPNDQFTVTQGALPTVSGLSQSSGTTSGGSLVTITGSNFAGVTGVSFGSVSAYAFTVNSSSSITAITPQEGAGTVGVTVTTYTGTSSNSGSFTFAVPPTPVVTGLRGSLQIDLRRIIGA